MLAVCLQRKLKAKARVYSEEKINNILNCFLECVNKDTNKPYLESCVELARNCNSFLHVSLFTDVSTAKLRTVICLLFWIFNGSVFLNVYTFFSIFSTYV